MPSLSAVEELNTAIEVLFVDAKAEPPVLNAATVELVDVARDLLLLPNNAFRARLRAELKNQAQAQAQAFAMTTADSRSAALLSGGPCVTDPLVGSAPALPTEQDGFDIAMDGAILPTLLGKGYADYPLRRTTFAASFLLHAAAAALILSSGLWMVEHRERQKEQLMGLITEPSPYVLPPAPDQAGGGGGGGDADKLQASKGVPPRFAREQLAPPAIVIRNSEPKLSVEATLVGPPQLTFPQIGPVGDPLSAVLAPPSNGIGSDGGIGSGRGNGVGSGHGPGFGAGSGGGFGDGTYRVGGGVSAPRAIFAPDPDFSEEARKAKYQGTVVLWAVIGPDGRVKEVKTVRSLGMGLDEKAHEAVRKWRFEPAMKDGQPVAVQVNIEVKFHLY